MIDAYEIQFVIVSIEGYPIVARVIKFQFPLDALRLDREIAKILIQMTEEIDTKKDVN